MPDVIYREEDPNHPAYDRIEDKEDLIDSICQSAAYTHDDQELVDYFYGELHRVGGG